MVLRRRTKHKILMVSLILAVVFALTIAGAGAWARSQSRQFSCTWIGSFLGWCP